MEKWCGGCSVKQLNNHVPYRSEGMRPDEVGQPSEPLPQRVPYTELHIQPVRVMNDVAMLERVWEGLRKL